MTDVTDRPPGVPMPDRPPGVPMPDPELRRLEALVGTWAATEHTKDTILGPGVPVTYTETFHWLEGGYFLVQEYESMAALDGQHVHTDGRTDRSQANP